MQIHRIAVVAIAGFSLLASSGKAFSASDPREDIISIYLDRAEGEPSSQAESYTPQEPIVVSPRTTPYPSTISPQQATYDIDRRLKQSPPIAEDYDRSIGGRGRHAAVKKELDFIEAKISVLTGYRVDDFNWNIAGTLQGTSPNILSELSWDNLEIFQVEGNAQVVLGKRLRLEGSIGYGWIYKGDNQDSDYDSDDRQDEFSRSNNNTDDDDVLDWSLGAGWQFHFGGEDMLLVDKFTLAFLGGWSHHEMNLRMTDGFQTIPPDGPFPGLNSTYQAEWDGPWMGVEVSGRKGKVFGFARFEYHWADYFAKADWNLRDDFQHPVSYTHEADGIGSTISLGAGYDLTALWSIYLRADIQSWDTDPGVDTTFFSDGSVGKTRLNIVNWESLAIMLGASLRY